jgi:hypothetical protein
LSRVAELGIVRTAGREGAAFVILRVLAGVPRKTALLLTIGATIFGIAQVRPIPRLLFDIITAELYGDPTARTEAKAIERFFIAPPGGQRRA